MNFAIRRGTRSDLIKNPDGTAFFTDGAASSTSAPANLVITAGTSPSGTIGYQYNWQEIDGVVYFNVTLSYSVVGATVTKVQFDMPSDMPTPAARTGVSGANVAHYFLAGGGANLDASLASGRALIVRDSGDTKYQFRMDTTSSSLGIFYAQGQYLAA